MKKNNLTLGAFSVPLAEGFVDEVDQIIPKLKSLKRFAAIISHYGPFNLKLVLPEEGQLGVLTKTGYHDGVLGLLQSGVDACFLPLPLDTQMAPGYFSSVISEQNYYISTLRNLDDNTSPVVSSLKSVTVIPLLLAILSILILELIAVKDLKIESLLTAIFKSIGISSRQSLTRRSSWLCFIQMLILMFPLSIFNASFNTQTIVGHRDYKIDTLKDIISQKKTPFFIEGISMYDFFKAKVTKDYAEIYERSVTAGLDEPFPLGPIPMFERRDLMVTFVSGIGKKLTPLSASISGNIKPNQDHYFSAKPFHRSLQAMLYSYNVSKSFRTNFNTLTRLMMQSGIVIKIESDIYLEFVLDFYPATLYDFYKSENPRQEIDISWKSLNYTGFYWIFYSYVLILFLIIIFQFFEIVIALLIALVHQ